MFVVLTLNDLNSADLDEPAPKDTDGYIYIDCLAQWHASQPYYSGFGMIRR